MDKENVENMVCVCVCVCVYSAMKKKEILPFATTWMDLDGIMLREVVRQRKINAIMISPIRGI